MYDAIKNSILPEKFCRNDLDIPDRIIILEIDINKKLCGKDLRIEYSRGSTNLGVKDTKSLFKNVATGDRRLLKKIKNDSLSEKRLAADGECLTCFVVRLSDSINWQFMQVGDPMMGYEKNVLNKFAYNPNRIDNHGCIITGESQIENCRTAFFVVDGTKCRDYVVSSNIEKNGYYMLPFTINIELFYSNNKEIHYLPIIIDPEIQWPGGTKPSLYSY